MTPKTKNNQTTTKKNRKNGKYGFNIGPVPVPQQQDLDNFADCQRWAMDMLHDPYPKVVRKRVTPKRLLPCVNATFSDLSTRCRLHARNIVSGKKNVNVPSHLRHCVDARVERQRATMLATTNNDTNNNNNNENTRRRLDRARECRRRAVDILYDRHPSWARAQVPKHLRPCVTKTLAALKTQCDTLAQTILRVQGVHHVHVPEDLHRCVDASLEKKRAGKNGRTAKNAWVGATAYDASKVLK